MIRVSLDGLRKQYDGVAIVDGASLEILPGELTFVLGPSGAGKTTLARLVAGLESPDEGEIYFDGRAVHVLPPQERKVGFVFQDDALWPNLTAAENVGYGLHALHLGRRDRRLRVAQALDAARADGLADKRPDQLSALQRRRVALARALVIEPHLLILDEPLGRLEPRVRREFRDEVRRLHDEAERTTLVLTHDAREALSMADRLAVMDLGRFVQVGTPSDVYNHPADAFVAQFLGPTNLLQGQVEAADPQGVEVVVRTPIGRLVGRAPASTVAAGARVTVMIRPESLGLGPTVPPNHNRFAATVERQSFLGEVRQVHLRGPGDWPLTALALQGQSQGLREGQGLTVSVAPEFVVVLKGKFASPV